MRSKPDVDAAEIKIDNHDIGTFQFVERHGGLRVAGRDHRNVGVRGKNRAASGDDDRMIVDDKDLHLAGFG